ncbi:MAG: hypothetical protein ACMUIP_03175 [bacterium]
MCLLYCRITNKNITVMATASYEAGGFFFALSYSPQKVNRLYKEAVHRKEDDGT